MKFLTILYQEMNSITYFDKFNNHINDKMIFTRKQNNFQLYKILCHLRLKISPGLLEWMIPAFGLKASGHRDLADVLHVCRRDREGTNLTNESGAFRFL